MRPDKIEQQLETDPYNTELWSMLLSQAHSGDDIYLVRDIYERVLGQFPTCARFWVGYAEFEMKNQDYTRLEQIFNKSLQTIPSLELWKVYLQYVRKRNSEPDGTPKGIEGRKTINEAYELGLQNIGLDKDSGSVWLEYLDFLKSSQTMNKWEEDQKVDMVRKVFQTALCIPLINIEQLWKDYDSFENQVNRMTAKTFLTQHSPTYMTARTALKELKSLTDPLQISLKSIPRPPDFSSKDVKLLNQWKSYIKWEQSNPLHFEQPDLLQSRIIFAFKQAQMALRFYPEIWFEFSQYYLKLSMASHAETTYKAASEANPTSVLLSCAYGEYLESNQNFAESKKVYENFIEETTKALEKITAKMEQELQNFDEQPLSLPPGEDQVPEGEIDGEYREKLRALERKKQSQRNELKKTFEDEMDKLKQKASLVWIHYMKFARRTDGIKGARAIFTQARKSQCISYHVFIYSALMEFYCGKDTVIPGKVFELGLKAYNEEPVYIVEYMKHLMRMNDDTNIRALFERSLNVISPEGAKPIWNTLIGFESLYGDLIAIQKLDERMADAYPNGSLTSRFADRTNFLNLNIESELGPIATVAPAEAETATEKAKESATEEKAPVKGKMLLVSVQPAKFSKPDFPKWNFYKPSADVAASANANPGTPNAVPPPISSQTKEKPRAIPPPNVSHSHVMPPPAPLPANVPEAVGYLLSKLPAPTSYNGPIIPPEPLIDIIKTLRTAHPEHPPAGGHFPPPHMGHEFDGGNPGPHAQRPHHMPNPNFQAGPRPRPMPMQHHTPPQHVQHVPQAQHQHPNAPYNKHPRGNIRPVHPHFRPNNPQGQYNRPQPSHHPLQGGPEDANRARGRYNKRFRVGHSPHYPNEFQHPNQFQHPNNMNGSPNWQQGPPHHPM